MSIAGILSSNLFSGGAAQSTLDIQKNSSGGPKFEQIKNEFQQLGQDLQSGNLTQAQADFTTLSANLPGASQAGATAAAATSAATAATTAALTAATTTTTPATAATTATTTGQTTVAQQFAQLGQDLQSGNLQAAQQDSYQHSTNRPTNRHSTSYRAPPRTSSPWRRGGCIFLVVFCFLLLSAIESDCGGFQLSLRRICRPEIFPARQSGIRHSAKTIFSRLAASPRPDRTARVPRAQRQVHRLAAI